MTFIRGQERWSRDLLHRSPTTQYKYDSGFSINDVHYVYFYFTLKISFSGCVCTILLTLAAQYINNRPNLEIYLSFASGQGPCLLLNIQEETPKQETREPRKHDYPLEHQQQLLHSKSYIIIIIEQIIFIV